LERRSGLRATLRNTGAPDEENIGDQPELASTCLARGGRIGCPYIPMSSTPGGHEVAGADINVCIAPDLCKVVLASFNQAQLIIAQIAEVVVYFHQESEGTPGACIELVGRFFRSDAPDMPAFPDRRDSLHVWRMWHARWRDAGDPRQYVAHAALAFPTTRLPRSAFSPP
jgi:hypothetical protein